MSFFGLNNLYNVITAGGTGSGTPNSIARWYGNSGKVLEGSTVLLDNAGNITGVNSLTVTTLIATTNITTGDNILTLDDQITGTPFSGNSGIVVQRGTSPNAQLLWNENLNAWQYGVVGTMTTLAPFIPGGTSGQIQYNNSGAFGGFGFTDGVNVQFNGDIQDLFSINAIDSNNRLLLDMLGNTSIDWQNQQLIDNLGNTNLLWSNGGLNFPNLFTGTPTQYLTLDAGNNVVASPTTFNETDPVFSTWLSNWQGGLISVTGTPHFNGTVSISNILDINAATTINGGPLNINATTHLSNTYVNSGSYIYSDSGYVSVDVNAWQLINGLGVKALDWHLRTLYDNTGSPFLSWTDATRVGIGLSTNPAGLNTVSIGANSSANSNYATSIGSFSSALGIGSTVIGSGTTAGNYSLALGYYTSALGIRSVAIGAQANASNNYSVQIGSFNSGLSNPAANSLQLGGYTGTADEAWLTLSHGIANFQGAPRLPQASGIANPVEGMIAWDYSAHTLSVYTGSAWVNLTLP